MEPGTVQRAYELAPECQSLEELRAKLRREGHSSVDEHLGSGSLRADLKSKFKKRAGPAKEEPAVD
ncbi:hypothetical protein G7078_08760 [Sphingomonas sinipercae]|uniref:Uncharacterized protein n=1 Tax=Sphingomonas sinipercae TaxID=2714944 RepID=A0A6G7ZPK9_9SPHN|nr:hypothetical protein [Sphingomonas sinipercae]QIL02865.1 hypothetical protein G7078_08760 [Sphingomonas sinipercae]